MKRDMSVGPWIFSRNMTFLDDEIQGQYRERHEPMLLSLADQVVYAAGKWRPVN
jgi:hypothetical protein